jgi:nucleoside 2-deoxyribosyltransferase
MNIYLAGNVRDHQQFREYASALSRMGFRVVSTWHQDSSLAEVLAHCDEHNKSQLEMIKTSLMSIFAQKELPTIDTVKMLNPEFVYQAKQAVLECKRQLDSADVVIAFTEAGSFEAGYAIGTHKTLITVGSLNSPFSYYSPGGNRYAVHTWPEAWAKVNSLRMRLHMKQRDVKQAPIAGLEQRLIN